MNGQQNFEGMRDTAARIREIVEKMHGTLDEASTDIHQTTDTWQSGAADHLRDKYKDLTPKFDDFYTAITNYADFLEKTAAHYEEFEQQSASSADDVITSEYSGSANA